MLTITPPMNPQSTTLEASMLTITPPVQFVLSRVSIYVNNVQMKLKKNLYVHDTKFSNTGNVDYYQDRYFLCSMFLVVMKLIKQIF